jgi:hypothetical protein
MVVANSTSHGTMWAKMSDGVSSRSSAPRMPPTKLMPISACSERPLAPLAFFQPCRPAVSWPGNSATVEVMLAARASIPVSISAGKVMKEPPPANAFWQPAQRAAKNSTASGMAGSMGRT